jgi:hypothetical protein
MQHPHSSEEKARQNLPHLAERDFDDRAGNQGRFDMHVHYRGERHPTPDVETIVMTQCEQVRQELGDLAPEATLDISLTYDLRRDAYEVSLDLNAAGYALYASAHADLRWAAVHAAFSALLRALRDVQRTAAVEFVECADRMPAMAEH